MKLIIDIPEVYYEALSKTEEMIPSQRSGKTLMDVIYSAVGNGIPLDDVKAEIQDLYVGYRHGYEIMADVLRIIDNVGKEAEE